ncbi:MAG: cytidylyltransferase family protein [Rhizobium sp.]|nr:cytidylyltransferase family protein [Rhizobium sp.]
MSPELRLRTISAVVLAAVVLAATWIGGLVFSLLAALISVLIFYEWATITGQSRNSRLTAFGFASLVILAVQYVFIDAGRSGFLSLLLLLGFTLAAVIIGAIRKRGYWLAGGIFYAGLSGISLTALRGGDREGLITMLFIFAIVWATDIFAYFTGRAIGGPKLAPPISPGKTWSGAIGGTIAGVICGMLVIYLAGESVGFGLAVVTAVLSIGSQIGDLFESWIKRRFGVKDSSRLIPGHGGVLDRVDGLVFACFLAFLGGMAMAVASGRLITDAGSLVSGG